MKRFRERLDLIAIISLPYILTIVWQYFVFLPNRLFAWTLAIIISVAAWYVLIAIDENPPQRIPWQFWLVVSLPLLLIFAMRVAFPDISFDVLNYHILHSERALRGPFILPGDFFPTPAPFNPTPDILTGLYRYVLGYRLGTSANLFALIWTGAILDRLLRQHVRSPWLRSAGVLFVLLTEQILFQVNEYMVDLLALPLLLEATLLALTPIDARRLGKTTSRLALFLGLATAFKLANLLIAVPVVLVFLFNLVKDSDREVLSRRLRAVMKSVPVAGILFVIPFAPFTLFIYRLTGNPVFPLYNGLFKSPYWPKGMAFDPRWGPFGLYETVIWPVLMYFKPDRLSEFRLYSGRLTIGYLVSVLCLIIARGNSRVRALAFITLLGTIIWSATSGYIRYAIYLELTSGILLLWLLQTIWEKFAHRQRSLRALAAAPLILVLMYQTYYALRYTAHWEWSGRTTVGKDPTAALRESRDCFRDRSLWSYVTPDEAALFSAVDVWIETTYKTTAIEALLKPEAPVIGVRNQNYFLSNEGRQKFGEALQLAQGKRMFTLTNGDGLDEAKTALTQRGLIMGKTQPVAINYFSALKMDLLLVEVLPGWQNNSEKAPTGAPMPDMAFKARLSVAEMPNVMRAGQPYTLRVSVRNESLLAWPGRQPEWKFSLTIANRWLTAAGVNTNDVDGRVALVHDLKPSENVELLLKVTAPNTAGDYVLQLDMVQEGVAWFGDRGSEVLNLKVKVE